MRATLLMTVLMTATPLLAAAQPAPDFAELMRAEHAAADRGDAAALRAFFCPNATTLRPDGLVTPGERLLANARPEPSPPRRSWGRFTVTRDGPVAVVIAPTTVEGRWGKVEAIVTQVWRERPEAQPCLVFHGRAAGGDGATAAMWDYAFLASEAINRQPNRLLTEAVRGVKPGAALDVGMGQGRNAVWLAKQGWQVTGFDVSGEGMRLAREQAAAEGVRIETVYAADRDFDFGRDRWDLIAFVYSPLRGLERRAFEGLRPGGMIVAEAFGNAGNPARASQGVFYAPDEMRRLFEAAGFRTVRYEEPIDVADYGLQRVPLVRLVAVKPDR